MKEYCIFDRALYSEIALNLGQGKALDKYPKSNSRYIAEASQKSLKFVTLNKEMQQSIIWYRSMQRSLKKMHEENIISNAIVHGSYGDFTTTAFSDLEITLVLTQGTIMIKKKSALLSNWLIRDMNPLLMRIDPLQHHGVFFLSPELISGYDESILPLCAYEDAWAFKKETITFSVAGMSHELTQEAYNQTLKFVRDYEYYFSLRGYNPYTIKKLISNILLLPALFYQKNGDLISKKESLSKIIGRGDGAINRTLDVCTRLRKEWPKPSAWLGRLRGLLVKGYIPFGKIDDRVCSLYKHKSLQRESSDYLLPSLCEYCEAFVDLDL